MWTFWCGYFRVVSATFKFYQTFLVFSSLRDGNRRCPLPSFFPSLFFSVLSYELVVKTALIQHLELYSKITQSILCDQIVPPDDPMEDEDKVSWEWLGTRSSRKTLKLLGTGDSCAEQEQAQINTLST
jgi:hypothetical protein